MVTGWVPSAFKILHRIHSCVSYHDARTRVTTLGRQQVQSGGSAKQGSHICALNGIFTGGAPYPC